MFTANEFRQLARIGALAQAKRIVFEFPDILTELNQVASARRRGDRQLAIATTAAPPAAAADDTPRRRRRMSASARRRIGAAQRARWAKLHRQQKAHGAK